MSRDLTLKTFKPPGKKFRQMKKVYEACEEANIEIPECVDVFFNYEKPDDAGVEVELPVTRFEEKFDIGFQLFVADIPEDVTIIKFCLE